MSGAVRPPEREVVPWRVLFDQLEVVCTDFHDRARTSALSSRGGRQSKACATDNVPGASNACRVAVELVWIRVLSAPLLSLPPSFAPLSLIPLPCAPELIQQTIRTLFRWLTL